MPWPLPSGSRSSTSRLFMPCAHIPGRMTPVTKTKSISEMLSLGLDSFDERFEYLKLGGEVGRETFGFDRYINQRFYTSHEWKTVRNLVIVRDNGCDLGVFGYDIYADLLIHHMNPITPDDIINQMDWLLDLNYL